jgi:hypothetical protein
MLVPGFVPVVRSYLGGCPWGADAGQRSGLLVEVDLLSPYAAELRYDDDTVYAVERETASRWATAAVQWARGLVEESEDEQESPAEPEVVDGG